jgi:hypothetical protein
MTVSMTNIEAKPTNTMLTAVYLVPIESTLALSQQEFMSYVTLFALAATARVDPLKLPLL